MSQAIRHLYQRAGFGARPQDWPRLRRLTVERAVDELFRSAERAAPLRMAQAARSLEMDRSERRMAEAELSKDYTLEWLNRMVDPAESELLERVTLFWHGHFACRSIQGTFAIKQLATLRRHALGPFRDLCVAIARDPSMIRYLNNQQNRKDSPNENFARELLELFTIGPGHYSERDVKEAARAFTGWSSTNDATFLFRAGQHDDGVKTFMGRTGRFGGEDIIDIILDQPATARSLVRRFWEYYVSTPPDAAKIEALGRAYYDSGYDTAALLRMIFTADWFYAPAVRAAQIKSPVLLTANLRKQLNLTIGHAQAYLNILRGLGQELFHPPNVAGWPGGRAWIDNATLMLRLNLGAGLLSTDAVAPGARDPEALEINPDQRARKVEARVDLQPLSSLIAGRNLEEDFAALSDFLLATPCRFPLARLSALVGKATGEERLRRMLLVIYSSPEYQVA